MIALIGQNSTYLSRVWSINSDKQFEQHLSASKNYCKILLKRQQPTLSAAPPCHPWDNPTLHQISAFATRFIWTHLSWPWELSRDILFHRMAIYIHLWTTRISNSQHLASILAESIWIHVTVSIPGASSFYVFLMCCKWHRLKTYGKQCCKWSKMIEASSFICFIQKWLINSWASRLSLMCTTRPSPWYTMICKMFHVHVVQHSMVSGRVPTWQPPCPWASSRIHVRHHIGHRRWGMPIGW